MIAQWWTDLRHAARALRRTPGFLLASIGTLTLAIGAVAGMFSVVNAVLLKPLPYPAPDRLVALLGTAPGTDLPDEFGLGSDFYIHYKENSKLIDGIFAWNAGTSTFRAGERVERIPMSWPTNDMYATLGVRPQLGRIPVPEDGDDVVVISDQMWESWFGRDPSILGKSFFVSDEMKTIVGIMPPDFGFPSDETLLWVAGEIDLDDVQPGNLGLPLVARMKPGVTHEELAAELTRLSKQLPERFGGPPNYARIIAQHNARAYPILERMLGPTITTSLWVLLGAVSIVLLMAFANVANLFLVRAEGRRRDMAVRRAIGASRSQLIRLQMAEALLVALPAGVLAVALSAVWVPAFISAAPQGIPRLGTAGIDVPTILMALGVVIVATIACGGMTALRASVPNLMHLREGGRGSTGGRHLGRDLLVVGQSALALVLLIGSALLVQSFQRLRNVDPGYDTENIYTFQFAPEQEDLNDGPSFGRFHNAFMDRLRAIPGVQAVGVVNNLPLDEGTSTQRFFTESMTDDDGGVRLDMNFTGGDYFKAIGIDLVQGRTFTPEEAFTPNSNVIVSRSTAEKLWPNESPIGKRIRWRLNPQRQYWFTVVGVVADVKQDDWREEGEAVVYLPLTGPEAELYGMGSPAYVVKTPNADNMKRQVRELVREVAPEAPVYREYTMEFLAQRSMIQLSFTMLTLGVISVLALILGVVGLYGVLAYVVTSRTREIGVRMALGATMAVVRRQVVSQGTRVVLVGVAIGIVAAFASTRLMNTLLFNVKPADPVVFAGMSLLIVCVGMAASYMPARRASLVHPTEALRSD